MDYIIPIIVAAVMLLLGIVLGIFLRKRIAEEKIGSAEKLADTIISDASRTAESKKKEALLEAKDEIHRLRDLQEEENRERRMELQSLEKRVLQKEESLDRKTEQVERKNDALSKNMKKVSEKEKQIDELIQKKVEELERVAGLSREEAKQLIIDQVRSDAAHDSAMAIREYEERTKDQAQEIAREIVTTTIQRYATEYVAESTVSVVSLPNDEMKGRIIGREGRNIRAFETITGVDLIIDDTPEAVVLSCFEPVRREVARIALEKLIHDGRIHPTRIEEMVKKAQDEVAQTIKRAGEEALEAARIRSMHPELVKTIGRLKYRTSYGQNALEHSIEVANLAGMLAEELGANVRVARRGGLLHDIGKAIDHEVEGTHVQLGVNLCKKYKESKEVIHCIESHHFDVEPESLEAIIVQTADAISASRPGARRESMQNYVQRLQDLEGIATRFDGIESAYAIQAGREVRVLVKPEKISEDEMVILAKEIAKNIEDELEYPGQIKVNMIRETRVQEYAK